MCTNCTNHLLRLAAYLKWHSAILPSTTHLCKYLFRNCDLEGQDEYELYPEIRAKIFDLKEAKLPITDDLANNKIYQAELLSLDKNGNKMRTRDLPSLNAFPDFNLEKESKMWLTQLEPPSLEKKERVKELIRNLVRKYGPDNITIPPTEAVIKLGNSLYSDNHVPKTDYEKPEFTWTSSWTYQKFKTDARTEREVWLPPKGYKLVSSWWHFFTEPLMKRVPFTVCNETVTEVRKSLHRRFKPCKKIDLKGFGLQFPREYIAAAMETLQEEYPSDEVEDYTRSTLAIFDKMSIKMGDLKYVSPKRGVGLGYFSNLMTLVVASLLQDKDVVYMFNDDILVNSNRFEEAIEELESYDFIINDKKTGGEWLSAPFFAGVSMAKRGSLRYMEAQGERAAIFTKRYHYQRKQILLSINVENRWKANYHYERLFGYEVFKGEAFLHPSKWGLDPYAQKSVGWVRGGLLSKYVTDKSDDEESRRIWNIGFPWKEPKDKDFAAKRANAKSKKDYVYYTEYDSYLNPKVKDKLLGDAKKPDFMLGSYQLPRWADLQSIMFNQVSSGRTTMGRYPKRAAYHMLDFLLSSNPINSWISGGYEVDSDFYRSPGLTPEIQLLYSQLRETELTSFSSVNKREIDTNKSFMAKGEGISFLKGKEDTTISREFVLDIQPEEVEYEFDDSDVEQDFNMSDEEIALIDSDDDSIVEADECFY
ncbi:putative RNA-dependent RNA polymerase [Downy mildew lesion associated ormycovirus 3]|uniref:RNA-dependent RNA polymerase n=1 Tax=Downy mildew lesion associated ormycovirus 3 TaxID=3162771 RepID=A0AAT9QF47_9VIRU|nr:putative RNA-dependent RNA polymerase [Plasmopara viticola lesion-associated ormycovirus 3]